MDQFRNIAFMICLLACRSQGTLQTSPTSVKDQTSDLGFVMCAHPIPSKIGVSILEKGRNDIDAGMAVLLALVVVYNEAGNLRDGGLWVVSQFENNGKKSFLVFPSEADS